MEQKLLCAKYILHYRRYISCKVSLFMHAFINHLEEKTRKNMRVYRMSYLIFNFLPHECNLSSKREVRYIVFIKRWITYNINTGVYFGDELQLSLISFIIKIYFYVSCWFTSYTRYIVSFLAKNSLQAIAN